MIPTNTQTTVSFKTAVPTGLGAIVLFAAQGKDKSPPTIDDTFLSKPERQGLARMLAGKVITGNVKEIGFELVGSGKDFRRVYSVGLGKADAITAETFRQAAGSAMRALRKHKVGKAAFVVPATKISQAAAAEALASGALLASFDYEEYKGKGQKKDDDAKHIPMHITLVAAAAGPIKSAVDRGVTIATAQNFARTIASRPGNDINPPTLAKVAQDLAREVGLGCKVFDEKQLAKLGMSGILAVGMGAIDSPPRLIVLKWEGGAGAAGAAAKKAKPLLVVGKAITFDAGGISIKPADKMGKMIFDKCGGMAVLGMMYAVAKLKLPIPVIGILSSAENILSEKAYRPGDILRMYNGVTVEVTNTDAEGRLVLGDAIAWGIEQFAPSAVIDLATLTGGVIVALGKTMAGIMTNSDQLMAELQTAADTAGEKIWRLPLGDEQREQMKSQPADIVNSAGRDGHPLQGGAFLSYFVPDDKSIPWAHLDIAGVADTEKTLPYYETGATGWGVRTLVEWATQRGNARK
ncbi:MAG TPA: leucyl aminopeptidase [Tepidisphaeraceae bacterium]|jgi:leucyl aminopeptidase|nr:leucyl aminopeptidase [Tepidisphaeraceae bacterium]